MLFFEYFKLRLNTKVKITLRNGMVMSGILTNVDPFLNMYIERVILDEEHPGLNKISVCSIRGSAIKKVSMDHNDSLDNALVDATRMKWCLESKE